MEIWNERDHVSEVSGEPLGSTIPHAYYFSHILSKGAHPALKFEKRNIMLMTFDEHYMWEFDIPERGDIWDKVYERKQEMLELEKNIKNKYII
jgi:hypothetical protein